MFTSEKILRDARITGNFPVERSSGKLYVGGVMLWTLSWREVSEKCAGKRDQHVLCVHSGRNTAGGCSWGRGREEPREAARECAARQVWDAETLDRKHSRDSDKHPRASKSQKAEDVSVCVCICLNHRQNLGSLMLTSVVRKRPCFWKWNESWQCYCRKLCLPC